MEANGKGLFIQIETQFMHKWAVLKFFSNEIWSSNIWGGDAGEDDGDDDVMILMMIMIMLMSVGVVCGETLAFYLLNDG
jgi:hypothetical protein